jgi:predicted transcriptional regulator
LFNARDHDNDSWENIVKEYSIGILKMKFEYKKNEWESIRKSMKVYDQNTLR